MRFINTIGEAVNRSKEENKLHYTNNLDYLEYHMENNMDQGINEINPIDHLDKARKMHDGCYKQRGIIQYEDLYKVFSTTKTH